MPATVTVGKQQPANKLTDLLRKEIAQAGYLEVLNFALNSFADNYQFLQRKDDGKAVVLTDPKAKEFQCGRRNLLSGILKSIKHNKHIALPLRVFEVGDVIELDPGKDVGAKNRRHVCAVFSNNTTSGFEHIHGLLDRLMIVLGIPGREEKGEQKLSYHLQPSEDPAFFPGLRADVIVNDQKIGVLGVVHPVTLEFYELTNPCSALEIEIGVHNLK